MFTQPHPYHTEHVIYAGAPKLLQQVVISLVLTHDLHVQLWLVTGPDSEPSIKVKEEVVRLGPTYQPEHWGPQKLCWLGVGGVVTTGDFIMCAFRFVCTFMGFFLCVCVQLCVLFNSNMTMS